MVATGRTTKNRPPESVSVKGHVILQVDDMMTTRTTKAPPSSFVGKSSPFRNHKFRLLSCMGASLGTALNSRCTSTSSPFIERSSGRCCFCFGVCRVFGCFFGYRLVISLLQIRLRFRKNIDMFFYFSYFSCFW